MVAADAAARDDTTRELAQTLREALARRVEQEHADWLNEVTQTLADGRTVRALRLSSRPPKAGAPLPAELATRLTEATNVALTAETGTERYATVLDALAYSPVRQAVVPQGVPAEPGEALLAAVRKLAGRVPQIAALFGIEPAPAKGTRSRGARSGAQGPRAPEATGRCPRSHPSPTAGGEDPGGRGSGGRTPHRPTPHRNRPPRSRPHRRRPAQASRHRRRTHRRRGRTEPEATGTAGGRTAEARSAAPVGGRPPVEAVPVQPTPEPTPEPATAVEPAPAEPTPEPPAVRGRRGRSRPRARSRLRA